MPFLTLFSAPKPFTDPHIAIIQRNAIRSWLQLGSDIEVLLVGQEPGLAEVCQQLGVRCLPQVRRNPSGTPLVSSIFELARQTSQSPFLAYLNADILVMPDFLAAAHLVSDQAERFLVVGQRWDLELRQQLEFTRGWEARLRAQVQTHGRLHPPAGSDYFIFPRPLFDDMPDFAIGRAGWDNWVIYHALHSGWEVVDATPSIMVIHQDHDYRHLPGGRPHYDHVESQHNQDLAGGQAHLYMLLDTNRELIARKIKPHRPNLLRLIRLLEVRLTPDGRRQGLQYALARRLRRMRRAMSGSL
ncbi:MAG TPA: hypothetical protein VJ436_02905 [Anaerolineales bacterium]|nr:hypothetical protein [Anaerolineales bacterium]